MDEKKSAMSRGDRCGSPGDRMRNRILKRWQRHITGRLLSEALKNLSVVTPSALPKTHDSSWDGLTQSSVQTKISSQGAMRVSPNSIDSSLL